MIDEHVAIPLTDRSCHCWQHQLSNEEQLGARSKEKPVKICWIAIWFSVFTRVYTIGKKKMWLCIYLATIICQILYRRIRANSNLNITPTSSKYYITIVSSNDAVGSIVLTMPVLRSLYIASLRGTRYSIIDQYIKWWFDGLNSHRIWTNIPDDSSTSCVSSFLGIH